MISPYKMAKVFNKFSETCSKQNVVFKRRERWVFFLTWSSSCTVLKQAIRAILPIVASCNTKGKLQSVVLEIFTSCISCLYRKKKVNCIYPVSTRIFNHYICFSSFFHLYYFILWYKVEYVQLAEHLPFTVRIISSWL